MTLERGLTEVQPDVWRLVAANPSPMTGPGTNTYIVGAREPVIIDPGPDDEGHRREIVAALAQIGSRAQAIIVTHPHADHDEGGPALAQRLAVPLLRLGRPLRHNQRLGPSSLELVVQHTPGHVANHICLWAPAARLLFAGDLVKGNDTVLIIPPDGDMVDYLNSLQAMQALEPAVILPGHGPVIEDAPQRLQAYVEHRLAREQQVLHWWRQGCTTAEVIAGQIYADRPELLNIATLQVEAHLDKLRNEQRL